MGVYNDIFNVKSYKRMTNIKACVVCVCCQIDVYFAKNCMSVSAEIIEGFCMPK